ncbi:ATP-binding protein [Enterobacter hormaechei]
MANDITFPATLTSVSPLSAWLERQMASLSVSDDWRFALDLAACETATNIIRHALHEDPERCFTVEFIVTVSDAALRFTDDGDKFPAERLAAVRDDATFDASLLAESGRGLKLILLYVDNFTVENIAGKNITVLEKRMVG